MVSRVGPPPTATAKPHRTIQVLLPRAASLGDSLCAQGLDATIMQEQATDSEGGKLTWGRQGNALHPPD